jgi:hypothetical protein
MGFVTGRQYERGSPASSLTAEVVAKNSANPGHTGEKPDLALKGENDAPTEVTQAKPATTPRVVVLNPGTADQEGNSQTQASEQASTPPSTRRDATNKKASDDRPSTSRRPMQGYQDLREYVLGR